MKCTLISLVLGFAGHLYGAEASPPSRVLGLTDYLAQVRAGHPEARSLSEGIRSLELRIAEAEGSYSPEFFSEYRISHDRKQPLNNFSPSEIKGRNWKLGVRDKTTFGLSSELYLNSDRTTLGGVNPAFVPLQDYEISAFGLSFQQSLWRNGFGDSARAEIEAKKASTRAETLKRKFALKNLILKAENTYWSLVSYNQVVKLQVENVERAKRLRDWMRQRASLRLFDDVDAMQAEASFEQRELDLQTSMDERAVLIRAFNTLRGRGGDTLENLKDMPTGEFMEKLGNDKTKRMSREDFQIILEEAKASGAQAKASISNLRPQLDIQAGISGNGLDPATGEALTEARSGRHPSWNIGLVFSVPLDYSLVHSTKESYRSQRRAAESASELARFSEERAWDDLVKQNREAQRRFERTVKLENLQTELVKRERRRLLNGRSTTFQSTTIEQNLALAQIARVRAQLALLQLHSQIKQFEEIQ